jgi:hypothetical protein
MNSFKKIVSVPARMGPGNQPAVLISTLLLLQLLAAFLSASSQGRKATYLSQTDRFQSRRCSSAPSLPSSPEVPTYSQLHPIHALTAHFLTINIILPSTSKTPFKLRDLVAFHSLEFREVLGSNLDKDTCYCDWRFFCLCK